MRRVLVLAASTVAMLVSGCGGQSYEKRLNATIERMRYTRRLDDNLMPAAKGKLEPNLIYVRPPKAMEGPAKEFLMTGLDAEKFDVFESYLDGSTKSALHVLARVPRPKTPAGKKAAPPPANRADFLSDLAAELARAYNVEVDLSKAKEETKQPSLNKFKHLVINAGNKDVQVYTFGSKLTYEVALVFEYPKSELKALTSRIELTLGSFQTGEKARRAFSGGAPEEGGEGEGGAPAVAF